MNSLSTFDRDVNPASDCFTDGQHAPAATPETTLPPAEPTEPKYLNGQLAPYKIQAGLDKKQVQRALIDRAAEFAVLTDDALDALITELDIETSATRSWLRSTWRERVISHRPPPPPEPPPPPAPVQTFWTTLPAGEYGNAQVFLELHGKKVAFNSAYGWMIHSERQRRWVNGDAGEAQLDKLAINMLLERQRRAVEVGNDAIARQAVCTSRNVSNVKNMIRPYVTVLPDEFDNDPNLLNTQSGVIDLRTGKIVADESGRFTYCCPVEYDPDADYTQWLQWLDSTVEHHQKDEKLRDWLQMCMGYSVTGHTREECLFYLYGPTRSGKGTLNAVQLAMLGDPLGRGAAFSTFTRRRTEGNAFDLAPLKAARLIVASEGEKKIGLNAAMVKTVTGRDPITTAFKGKDEFTYLPAFKIWLASNHPVSGDPDDAAFWNRVKVISFPYSKEGKEDKSLKARMTTPEYLKMVLAYVVHGAKMWHNSPTGLVTPDCVRQITEKQRENSDPIGQWLTENTVASPDKSAGHAKLHADYVNWCKENGYTPKFGKSFAESMEKKGFEPAKFYLDEGKGKRQIRGYKGLDLTE